MTERVIKIDVEPEEPVEEGETRPYHATYCKVSVTDLHAVKLSLSVQYPDGYPDVIPELTLETLEGEIDEVETSSLLDDMRAVVSLRPLYYSDIPSVLIYALIQGEENMGMAMTFAMVSNLREQLSTLIRKRVEEHQRAEMEKERKVLEVRTPRHDPI